MKCCGILGYMFGHNFKPRYANLEKEATVSIKAIEIIKNSVERLCEVTSSITEDRRMRQDAHRQIVKIANNPGAQIYIKDICRRCGYEINGAPQPANRRLDTEL